MPCQRPYLGEILVAEVSVGLYLEDLAQEKLGSVDISTTLQWLYVKCHHTSRTMAEDHRIPAGMS